MIDLENLQKLAQSLTNQLPSGFDDIKADLEKNFRATLQQQFVKLDLVSREEFDTQQAVLARTREKLEALEKLVAALDDKTK